MEEVSWSNFDKLRNPRIYDGQIDIFSQSHTWQMNRTHHVGFRHDTISITETKRDLKVSRSFEREAKVPKTMEYLYVKHVSRKSRIS